MLSSYADPCVQLCAGLLAIQMWLCIGRLSRILLVVVYFGISTSAWLKSETKCVLFSAMVPSSPTHSVKIKGEVCLLDQTSNQTRIPAEFKHITKRRKRN